MNDMRKLMEALDQILSEADVRYDPQPGDDEPLNNAEEFDFGGAKVTMDGNEVSVSRGHGQNMWFTRDEWQDFVDGITGQGLRL